MTKNFYRCGFFIFSFFLFLLFPPTVFAQHSERILSFQSLIEVRSDASLGVTETIQVYATGANIKHGIYRDFPTSYTDRFGVKHRVGFNIVSIERDNAPEGYHLSPLANGIRVYIGKQDVMIPSGVHTYVIHYQTDRQIGFFKDFDELYWNVTGNGWDFPIDAASATVILPGGATVQSTEGYTGPFGAKGKDFTITNDFLGRPFFQTTRRLNPREGLTIVAAWPKGFVKPPTQAQQAAYIINDNRSALIGLVGFLTVLLYYMTVWVQHGRDPEKGTIIPLFHPPENLSPAAIRYVMRMGFDHKAVAATLINFAVKGCLTIEVDPLTKEYTLRKADRNQFPLSFDASAPSSPTQPEPETSNQILCAQEREMMNILFAKKKSNHPQYRESF